MTRLNSEETKEAVVAPEEAPQRRKKVAILGFTDSRLLAPFDDPDYEIWGLNELYLPALGVKRWNRWFELHSRQVYEADKKRTDDHIGNLGKLGVPVYMHQHYDDIPNSVPYPLPEVMAAFPNPSPGWKPYLTNSITYMILLGIMEGFEEIGIYGVAMAHSSEYGQQRPSCEWAVGLAQGRGIKVYIPPTEDLMKTPFIYGYEEPEAIGFDEKLKARKAELEGKRDALQNEINARAQAVQQYIGAIADVEHMLTNWRVVQH